MAYDACMLKLEDYRDYLQSVVETKKIKNRLSLRSVARQCGLAPSSLHQLISKKAHLSQQRLKEVGTKLKLSRFEKKHVLLLYSYTVTEDPAKRLELEEKVKSNSVASVASYLAPSAKKSVLNWETLLLHEYLYLNRPTRDDLADIAGTLKISSEACQKALSVLVAHGLVRIQDDGRIERIHARLLADCVEDPAASRSFHQEVLRKTAVAVNEVDQNRYSVGEFVCVPDELLPEMIRLTNQYFDSVQALAKRAAEESLPKKIYMLMSHAFPASQELETKGALDETA
jgi:uncharacterized protein (TIGR02147 family)